MARADTYMLTPEELRLRRRRRRRIGFALIVALALVAAVVFGGRPAAGAIKAWQARRNANRAFAFIREEKWSEAREAALAGFQLRPTEPAAVRAVARLLSRTGQAEALEFWRQLAALTPLTREDRRDEATMALSIGETDRAVADVRELVKDVPGDPAGPADWLLAAQLAAQIGAPAEATSYLERIAASTNATEREQFRAALLTLMLPVPSADDLAAAARQRSVLARIGELAKGKGAAALDALLLLARQSLGATAEHPANLPMSAAEIAYALETHPLAKTQHRLLALDLLAHDDPAQRAAILDRAVTEFRQGDLAAQAALCTWLNGKGEYARALEVFPLEKAVASRDLFLQHVDSLAALGRWKEVQELLKSERYPLDPVVQTMYLARCSAQLGEQAATANYWQRALEAAGTDAAKLVTLAQYAEKNGAAPTAAAAYEAAVAATPRMRPAQQGRLRLAQINRDTAKAHAILAEMLRIWPDDRAVQNDEAYLRLLLLPDGPERATAAAAIAETAERLVQREPSSLPHRVLLALACLRQGQAAGALSAFADVRVQPSAVSPSALAVHAAALAANGHDEDARSEAATVPLGNLLPEERALVEPLLHAE